MYFLSAFINISSDLWLLKLSGDVSPLCLMGIIMIPQKSAMKIKYEAYDSIVVSASTLSLIRIIVINVTAQYINAKF